MRIPLLAFALLIASLFHAAAQVSVEVVFDETEFLRDESMFLKVRIVNRSGQALKLGQTADWLTFNVQSHDGHGVDKLGEVPVKGEFTVESSQTATKTVNLMPHYSFSQSGRYSVSATVRIPEWSDDFTSSFKPFFITRGVRIWDQQFGVPRKEGPPEVRLYSLVQATGMKKTRLYVRITDTTDNHVFRVVPLGQVVTFGKPEAQVDRASRLHVLFQNGARTFSYGVFTPDGEWVTRQTHEYSDTRPILRVNDMGAVLITGGARRFMVTDFPPEVASGAPTNSVVVPATSAPTAKPPSRKKDGKSIRQ